MFCVYLTVYLGDVLPPFYLGSSSLVRLNAGYKGSIKSRKYAKLWKQELKEHPELFVTSIISNHQTRIEATQAELDLQVALGVVKSPLFVNESLASPNGFFGRDTSGKNHPLYGIKRSAETRARIKKNHADAKGAKNGRARTFRLTSPTGEVFDVFGTFREFCQNHNLPYGSMLFVKEGRAFTRGPCVGWKCDRV